MKTTGVHKRSKRTSSPSEGSSHQVVTEASTSDKPAPKTRERKAEETEGPAKRRRVTQDPSKEQSPQAASEASSSMKPGEKSREKTAEKKEGPKKRPGKTQSPSADQSHQVTTEASSADKPGKRKRKGEPKATEGPKQRNRKPKSPSEESGHGSIAEVSSINNTSSSATAPPNSRAAFKAKYQEGDLLGQGGYACVFAGHRKEDNLPVAIKRISSFYIEHVSMKLDGKTRMVPLEVALMLKVKPAVPGTSAAVTLLDWYDLEDEVILVLERPAPCQDLIEHLLKTESGLQEHEVKIIARQLLDALIEVHSRGVFHGDIKPDNILIETGSDVPRIRIIDFGSGSFLSEQPYTVEKGTNAYNPPEWFQNGIYEAEPTTVWQLGLVLFGLLHRRLAFRTKAQIVNENVDITAKISFQCRTFLLSCLDKSPQARPSLETLRHFSWLK